MNKGQRTNFDFLAEGYSFWAWVMGPRGYPEALKALPESTHFALDAGCGSGVLSLQLADHVDYMVGVDRSFLMIKLAKSHQDNLKKKNVDFIVADLEKLPFKDKCYDFVVSNTVLHVTQLEVTLPGLRRLLKPRGRMVLCDIVSIHPRLDAYPVWRIFRILRNIPRYAFSHGFYTMWRILRFLMSPEWIQYICKDKKKKLTPEAFKEIYTRFLPGCRIESPPKKSWRMVVFWEAPFSENHKTTLPSTLNNEGNVSKQTLR